jgi:hypothetical protein
MHPYNSVIPMHVDPNGPGWGHRNFKGLKFNKITLHLQNIINNC